MLRDAKYLLGLSLFISIPFCLATRYNSDCLAGTKYSAVHFSSSIDDERSSTLMSRFVVWTDAGTNWTKLNAHVLRTYT
ncbi:hypothetical protein DER45DRAFT_645277 [Fusarium avenaceum]|nr:hypothetical protein DER45DRAFT_645277 [Fusarium avenaceum]